MLRDDWLRLFKAGCPIPPYIIPNPVTGALAPTKDGGKSFRCDAAVKSFRFAVAEFDDIPKEEQLRFWWALNLPTYAIVDSGGKSYHCWLKVDGVTNTAQWTAEVEEPTDCAVVVPV